MVRNNPVTMSDADVVKHIATHLTKYRRYLSKISKSSLNDRKIQDTLEAIGMTARTLQREAESMVNYDVIYGKKTRKNPTYSTEKTRRWKGVEYVTFYNEDSASPFAWSAWALGFGDLASGRSEAEVIERARGIISAGHKTLEGRKGMAKLYISADEQAAYKRGLHKRKNPAPTRKMAPAVKGRAALVKMAPAVIRSRAALVKKAFALREKTGSRMSPRTIMKDPAAAIRRLSK